MIAYQSLLITNKITRSKKPYYIAQKMNLKTPNENQIFPQRQAFTIPMVIMTHGLFEQAQKDNVTVSIMVGGGCNFGHFCNMIYRNIFCLIFINNTCKGMDYGTLKTVYANTFPVNLCF